MQCIEKTTLITPLTREQYKENTSSFSVDCVLLFRSSSYDDHVCLTMRQNVPLETEQHKQQQVRKCSLCYRAQQERSNPRISCTSKRNKAESFAEGNQRVANVFAFNQLRDDRHFAFSDTCDGVFVRLVQKLSRSLLFLLQLGKR